MNKLIIVGVDFSDCSMNALEHAVGIAKHSQSDMTMVWVNKAKQENSVALKDPEDARDDAIHRFEKLIEKHQPDLENSTMKYAIRDGKVYREIVSQAETDDAFLIVAGTHGSSGFEEFWIGSNAQKIVSASHCPVVTIRGGVNIDRNLSRIILPIDSTLETRQKAPFTTMLAKYFNAKIYVLGLYTTTVHAVRRKVNNYSEQVVKYLEENEVDHQLETIEADNITNDTLNFAKSVDANLISIMTEQEKTTANLWLGPYAHQMVNHSPIPVLSIQPKEFIRTLSR